MRPHFRNLSLLLVCLTPLTTLATGRGTFTGTFEPLQAETCINPSYFSNYTSFGKQYVDPNNGVTGGQWNLTTRWQGDTLVNNSVTYSMLPYTGFSSYNQRGYIPQYAGKGTSSAGTPGVQLSCFDVGFLINTFWNPHRPIPGGGYNDMWGYAWTVNSMPRPFVKNGIPTHLVLQGSGLVALYRPTLANQHGSPNRNAAAGQLSFFAYLVDTVHPALRPLAIIAGIFDSEWTAGYAQAGAVGQDYNSSVIASYKAAYPGTPNPPGWWQNADTADGVWFASAPISKTATQDLIDTYYTDGEENSALQPIDYAGSPPPMQFFRAHVTPTNMVNIINRINGQNGCSTTPTKCYSTTPGDYALQYAGVIAEARIRKEIREEYAYTPTTQFDAGPGAWSPNDLAKDQVKLGAHVYGVGIYRGVP